MEDHVRPRGLPGKKERDWLLELETPYELPQTKGVEFALPDLEGWRDTVLVNADAQALTRMREQSVQKAAGLEARAMAMAPMNETNKTQIYELLWQTPGREGPPPPDRGADPLALSR